MSQLIAIIVLLTGLFLAARPTRATQKINANDTRRGR